MAATGGKKARQRDARELALTRPADPYRGALTDPYANRPDPELTTRPGPQRAGGLSAAVDHSPDRTDNQTPNSAIAASIIAIGLGAVLALFGLLLLAIISLQDDYGAPDRSFYRGSDSSYLLLALLDFVLGAVLAIAGISLLGGRLNGRLAITVTGWTVLALCGFWWLRSDVTALMPLFLAVLTLAMLALCYQRRVTRWLGVLPAAQPE